MSDAKPGPQFRNTVLVVAVDPTAKIRMHFVTQALSDIWGLLVLCLCITDTNMVCTTACVTPSLTAMGMTVHVDPSHPPLMYAQPISLTAEWSLQYAVTM